MSTPAQQPISDVLSLQSLDLERMSRLMEMDFSGGSCLSNSCNHPKEEQASVAPTP
jgi:hypothetical protein